MFQVMTSESKSTESTESRSNGVCAIAFRGVADNDAGEGSMMSCWSACGRSCPSISGSSCRRTLSESKTPRTPDDLAGDKSLIIRPTWPCTSTNTWQLDSQETCTAHACHASKCQKPFQQPSLKRVSRYIPGFSSLLVTGLRRHRREKNEGPSPCPQNKSKQCFTGQLYQHY